MSRLVMVSVAMLLGSSLAAQDVLPVGSRASAAADAESPASFRFDAPSSGLLTVSVSGPDDLALQVVDRDGQPLPDGAADIDHGGNLGLEHVTVVITESGEYKVIVSVLGESTGGSFTIQAGFVPEPSYEMTSDPDRRPSLAGSIRVGTAHDDQLSPADGDLVDWFTITATESASLVFITRVADGTEGDLVLEGYLARDYGTTVSRSDQDLQGSAGNESMTINVKPGDVVHVKVQSLFDSGGPIEYRLSIGSVP